MGFLCDGYDAVRTTRWILSGRVVTLATGCHLLASFLQFLSLFVIKLLKINCYNSQIYVVVFIYLISNTLSKPLPKALMT